MKKLTMTRKELENFAVKALGIKHGALRRMSTLFLSQLLQMNLSGRDEVDEMVSEIAYLEGQYQSMRTDRAFNPGNVKQSDAWIVFKRYNGSNYYLTLANTGEGEWRINQRLHDAYALDFPFLEERHRLN